MVPRIEGIFILLMISWLLGGARFRVRSCFGLPALFLGTERLAFLELLCALRAVLFVCPAAAGSRTSSTCKLRELAVTVLFFGEAEYDHVIFIMCCWCFSVKCIGVLFLNAAV